MSWATAAGATAQAAAHAAQAAARPLSRKSVTGAALWGSTSAATPSPASAVTTVANRPQIRASDDVVVPLVLWDRPPRVVVTCMHVAYLPSSQPSQNSNAPGGASTTGRHRASSAAGTRRSSSTNTSCRMGGSSASLRGRRSVPGGGAFSFDSLDATMVDAKDSDDEDGEDRAAVQLAVFVGTVDGAVLYWLFEGDAVVQASLLIFAESTAGTSQMTGASVQGIASGVDEWGQSTLVSVLRDGAVARWQLPNGLCVCADSTLARELVPVKGVEMFCNNRFAIVFSEEARMMILDTWKMTLMHCVDTAQEQIRRSIAVGELKTSTGRPSALPSGSRVYSSSQDSTGSSPSPSSLNDSYGAAGNSRTSSYSDSGEQTTQPASINRSRTVGSTPSTPSPHAIRQAPTPQIWDSMIVSLGTEGLLKCFLWAKPRGVGTLGSAGFQWMQQSCWILSWADETNDITCSQSTSLRDGDNMNPQTALMRSIKTTYFPIAVQLSPNASFVLCIWKTKWVVLKRKWLCQLDGSGGGSASRMKKSFGKVKQKVRSGSCRVAPGQLVIESTADPDDQVTDKSVIWEDGRFLNDNQVLLWTSSGHAFSFQLTSTTDSGPDGGKFFIFTKDQDQLVPRSISKALVAFDKWQCVGVMNKCQCCQERSSASPMKYQNRLDKIGRSDGSAGFTSCVLPAAVSVPGASAGVTSRLQDSTPTFCLVHSCKRGSVGFWKVTAAESLSPARGSRNAATNLQAVDPTSYFYLEDGFWSAADAHKSGSISKPAPQRSNQEKQIWLSHLIVGRGSPQSSCGYEVAFRAGVRRRRRRIWRELNESSGVSVDQTGPSGGVMNALLSATGRQPQTPSTVEIRLGGRQRQKAYNLLLDVPVLMNGYTDGTITCQLLGSEPSSRGGYNRSRSSEDSDYSVVLSAHRGKVTAVAHCHWPFPGSANASFSSTVSAALLRDQNGEARPRLGSGSNSQLTSHADARSLSRRGSVAPSSCLSTSQNPFHRSRFPPSTIKRTASSRHLNASLIVDTLPAPVAPISASAPSSPRAGIRVESTRQPDDGLVIMVFSGGQDGVLNVIELTLQPAMSDFSCEANIIQRFRNHRGPIEQISISPTRPTDDEWAVSHPDRFIATIGADHKVVLYAPVYAHHPGSRNPPSSSSRESLGLEFECVFEFTQHPDRICGIDWHVQRGLVYIECEDNMVYVWSTDTGILERSIPCALLHGGGNGASHNGDVELALPSRGRNSSLPVDCSKLSVGDLSLHFLCFKILPCAEHIKTGWKNYFEALSRSNRGSESKPAKQDEQGKESFQSPVTTDTRSPYAIGSIELQLLSFLLSWGASPEIDQTCRELLGIDRPSILHSFALLGPSGAITLPVPWKTVRPRLESGSPSSYDFARYWQHSSAMSANLALGIVSLCMNLMEHRYTNEGSDSDGTRTAALPTSPRNKETFHVLWSQIITQHSVVLPDYVPGFREPALESLAKFGFDPCEYTQLAARTLLNGIIKRLTSAGRGVISGEYAAKLHCELARLETDTGSKISGGSTGGATIEYAFVIERLGSLVILLSMIGTCFPGEIAPSTAREVCDILVYLLKAPTRHVASVAAELLTKGLMLFRPHLLDLSSLVCQLLVLDMHEKQRDSTPTDDKESLPAAHNARVLASGGSNAALSLLVELGACESAFVLTLLQQEMNSNDRPQAYRECVLLYLTELINTHYLLMFRHLPAVVDTIMCCLDPTKPERRKRCLPLSTKCLQNLVRRFPMVDFHRETQRLAVGTMEAVILIYDLRTATKWRVLDGHASALSAVSFRLDGQILVSYAAREGSVRWWNSGNAGLFGGMLKMHQSCLKEHKLDVLTTAANAPASSGGASADLKQVIQTCRFHFLAVKVPSESPTGLASDAKTKQILRLTREDASQVQFLL